MLEFGCGSVALIRHLLAAAGYRVIATGASPDMLAMARAALGGEADLRRLALPDDPAVRIHSSGDTFLPSGTTRVSSSSRRISRGVCSTRWSLMAASCSARTLVTSCASVVIPGSSTRPPISHSTARSNSSRRESRVCAAREATNVRTSASASANSRYPSRPRISRACSCWVGSRSG